MIGTSPRRVALPPIAAGFRSAALALVAAVFCSAAQAQVPPRGTEAAPERLKPFIGAWDLEAVGKSRSCTVTFAAEAATRGRLIRFPATCRRALPILGEVTAWDLPQNGQPRLLDAGGNPVLAFASAGRDTGLEARGPDAQAYRLDPKGYARAAPRPAQSPAQIAAQSAQRRTEVDPAKAPTPEALPGVYGLMRQINREACRMELRQDGVAALARSCTDTGLTIFDPVSWRYAAGRLTLVARRGHSIELVFQDGRWRKDPDVGAPLMLRKLP